MSNCLPWDLRATDADGGNTASPVRSRVGRYLIVAMLLTAAALDLTRCGLGGGSAPQAAVSGFGGPYAIPDTATVALGILLAITILATAGRSTTIALPRIPGRSWTGSSAR
jgi:hypothetical protein